MRLEFIVPGEPVGKGRPKFARRGKFTQVFTPEPTARYENLVKMAAAAAMDGRSLISTHCSMTIVAHVSVPASWSRNKRIAALAGTIRPTSKPDLDNIFKAACDALNGIAFVDDKLVVEMGAVKSYAETPCLKVVIESS